MSRTRTLRIDPDLVGISVTTFLSDGEDTHEGLSEGWDGPGPRSLDVEAWRAYARRRLGLPADVREQGLGWADASVYPMGGGTPAWAQHGVQLVWELSSHDLIARRSGDGWSVEDPAGGIWHPGAALQRRLARTADPEAAVLRAARRNRGGAWHS